MNESIKAILALFVIIAAVGSFLAWADGQHMFPEHLVAVRAGLIGGGLGSLGLLIWAQFRRDKLPDLLRKISRSHLNCDGLSFIAIPEQRDRVCYISVYFQNRYQRPCTAQILFRPAVPNFGVRRPIDLTPIDLTIECDGAAFGVVRVPYPLPHTRQGAKVTFDVGGANHYPGGRGAMLRFTEGITIRPPTSLADTVVTGLSVLTGHFHRSKDASITLRFPMDVLPEVPTQAQQMREILWRPEASRPEQ